MNLLAPNSFEVYVNQRLRRCDAISTVNRRSVMLLPVGFFLATLAKAQPDLRVGRRDDYLRAHDLPHFLGRYQASLGERLQRPGLERLVSTGTLRERGADKSSVLTWELPGRFRIEKDNKAIVGALAGVAAPTAPGLSSEDEDDIIESLFLDRAESALYNVVNGAAVRVIGYQVGTQRSRVPAYSGPYFDVFDITTKVDSKVRSATRSKRYFFDSMSGLLQRVTYVVAKNAGPQTIDTYFSQWTKVQNEFVPGIIERRENQVVGSRFTAAVNQLSARVADGKLDRA